MRVVVDTSVWSLAIRRSGIKPSAHRELLTDIIHDGRVVMLGVIRQELLSGVKQAEQFKKLKTHLRYFPDLEMETGDYETGAEFYNTCISSGVQGSHIDFLICACAFRREFGILTTDPDFERYQRHIPLRLLQPEG